MKGHRVNALRVPNVHDAVPYDGPHDAEGVPLTAYCQELRAFVRSRPDLFADKRRFSPGKTARCRVCGVELANRKRWYCDPCKKTVVFEQNRVTRRECDRRRRTKLKEARARENRLAAFTRRPGPTATPPTANRAPRPDRPRHAHHVDPLPGRSPGRADSATGTDTDTDTNTP